MVSVIIPVYNGELYLAEAIESVLAQTAPALEILVVDDGSTDGSAAVARRFLPRILLKSQPNAGAGAAKNSGVRAACGELLAFLDADDIWLPHKLETQRAALRSDGSAEAVCGRVEQFVSPELDAAQMQGVHCAAAPLPGPLTSALLIRREAFLRAGWFTEDSRTNDFAEWWLRATEQGLRVRMVSEVLLRRRLHRGNMGRIDPDSKPGLLRLVKASLDRRRASETGGGLP